MMVLSGGQRIWTIPLAVFTQYQRVSDRRLDGIAIYQYRWWHSWMKADDNKRHTNIIVFGLDILPIWATRRHRHRLIIQTLHIRFLVCSIME